MHVAANHDTRSPLRDHHHFLCDLGKDLAPPEAAAQAYVQRVVRWHDTL